MHCLLTVGENLLVKVNFLLLDVSVRMLVSLKVTVLAPGLPVNTTCEICRTIGYLHIYFNIINVNHTSICVVPNASFV